jgi:Domain of unknown function (DU1801)
MESDASVQAYLDSLPEDRRDAIAAVRRVVVDHLPAGFEEVVQYGMISYVVPLERYPHTYNGQPLAVASLGNQKRHMALYLMGVYGDEGVQAWLRAAWAETGKKLDMGKSCLRFRKLDDLALDVVGDAIARTSVDDFIAAYERSRSTGPATRGVTGA